jgi:hypothetical protein
MNLRREGNRDAAKLNSEALDTTPTRATKIRKVWQKINVMVPYIPDEAFSLFIETKLTNSQYMEIRRQAKKERTFYPNYHKLTAAKEECYHHKEAIVISDSVAEVKLQALLDHTLS